MLKKAFSLFDKDGSGSIDRTELGRVFEELGKKLPEEELNHMMEHIDTDKSGTIDFQEFVTSYEAAKKKHRK